MLESFVSNLNKRGSIVLSSVVVLLPLMLVFLSPYLQRKDEVKPPPHSKFITLSSGLKIRYTDSGTPSSYQEPSSSSDSGTATTQVTFLAIHGWAGISETWNPLTKQLQKNYRNIAIDLPGNGFSDKTFSHLDKQSSYDYTIRDQGKTVAQFLQEMNLTNVVLIGHSAGCIVSISSPSTKQVPQRVIGAVLIAPGIFMNKPSSYSYWYMTPKIAKMVKQFIQGREESLQKLHKNSSSLTNDIADAFSLQTQTKNYQYALRRAMQAKESPHVDFLKDVSVPLHFVWSEEDFICPPAKKEVLELAKVHNISVSMTVMTDTFHYIQHEQPEKLAEVIIKFTQELSDAK